MRFLPRRRGQSFGGFGRRSMRAKPGIVTVNHYNNSFASAAGVELLTTGFTGVDDATNRSTHIPEGAIVTSVKVKQWMYTDPPALGLHRALLMFRPAAQVIATPITFWFTTTDPLEEEAIEIRRQKRAPRNGISTHINTTGAQTARGHTLFWKGRQMMREGDDWIVVNLDDTISSWYTQFTATYIM